jgi:hypothetical protein
MRDPDSTFVRTYRRGCLFALALAAVVVAGLVVAIRVQFQRSREELEREKAQWRQEALEKVRAGDDGGKIHVFLDARLIEMLANDPVCVRNLKNLFCDMADLTGPQTAQAAKLVNVRTIGFYDCKGVDNLLAALRGMPSVEEISIEGGDLSDDGIRLMASFPNLR